MKQDATLLAILQDREFARFGDSYINFAYSLAATNAKGIPQGVKVSDKILAEAARKCGLRDRLPKRTTRADSANAVEALLGHAYLSGKLTLERSVEYLTRDISNPDETIAQLATLALSLIDR